MNDPKPPFYELEFSTGVTFWSAGDASSRRALLMPARSPSEFLAFGVLGTSEQALFVARGRVREHLGAFIDRMVKDEARVELHARVPLPWRLVREYLSLPPYEGHEYENPPPPPVLGLAAQDVGTYQHLRGNALWKEGDGSTRRAFIVPVRDPSEFLAFGVLGTSERVLFALKGSVRDELGPFIARMVEDETRVELHPRAPLPEPILRRYIRAP